MSALFQLSDVSRLTPQRIESENSDLLVLERTHAEGGHIPFNIERVFLVSSDGTATRGKHMHKKCSQALFCIDGSIRVRISDGSDWLEFELSHGDEGVLIPPTLWAEQDYDGSSKLLVFCDRPYEAEDYIHTFEEFETFRQNQAAET